MTAAWVIRKWYQHLVIQQQIPRGSLLALIPVVKWDQKCPLSTFSLVYEALWVLRCWFLPWNIWFIASPKEHKITWEDNRTSAQMHPWWGAQDILCKLAFIHQRSLIWDVKWLLGRSHWVTCLILVFHEWCRHPPKRMWWKGIKVFHVLKGLSVYKHYIRFLNLVQPCSVSSSSSVNKLICS